MKKEAPVLVIDTMTSAIGEFNVTDFGQRQQIFHGWADDPLQVHTPIREIANYMAESYRFREVLPTSGWLVYEHIEPDQ